MERGFKDILLRYIESNSEGGEVGISLQKENIFINEINENITHPFVYLEGDWEKYVTSIKYKPITENLFDEGFSIEKRGEVNINSYGSLKIDLLYGKSKFTKDSYRRYDEDKPVSRVIKDGFNAEHELQLHMEGDIGRRLTVYIDHDSDKSDNHYVMRYRAIREEEVIREINAGEIDINLEKSKYVAFDETSMKGIGIDVALKKENLRIRAFGSVSRGETEIEIFRGNASPSYIRLSEYQYIRNIYYQIEPFIRYDNRISIPSDGEVLNSVVVTSSPSNPEIYTLYPVNIEPSGFEIYIDDKNPQNNYNAIRLTLDNCYYSKLISGIDYKINYATGLITFIKNIPENANIFAVYWLKDRSTADPCALSPGSSNHPGGMFSGKNFVFIKYGYSLDETHGDDVNGDGRINRDIYEIRSFYNIGDRQLLEDNFRILFYRENTLLPKSDVAKLGKYSVDYTNGIVEFHLREPFRQLLDMNDADVIYSEKQQTNAYLSSIYKIRIDYYREARSFQLKHFNIIPESVRIRINGLEIAPSLYSLDYTSGFLEFIDPNNPLIGPKTEIEVKYEYLPFNSQSKSFSGGIRGDYRVNRSLDVGGTLLYTRESGDDVIPNIGSEPEQTLVFEGDTSLHLGEARLKRFINNITGIKPKSVPVEIDCYAEYARSYKKINTFGKALIDSMEATDEIVPLSLSEKDWWLSSMPIGLAQDNRGILYYYYYRDPFHPDTLRGIDFIPYSVSYSIKPGPYNVAIGHIPDSIQPLETQRSLVLNFDFSTGDCIPIVTPMPSAMAVDFSGLQYVEIWYRAEGVSGEVDFCIDIGRINEDSDDDDLLDTEDVNNNGFLDYDPSAGIEEDIGYQFDGNVQTIIGTGPKLSQITMGDGALNSEDLNRNGILDKDEHVITLPGVFTTPSSAISIDGSNTDWENIRIYLDRDRIDDSQIEILKQVESLRLYLLRNSAVKGTIYINSIRFVSSSWRDDSGSLRITKVDTLNDADYRAESYISLVNNNYESLYGDKNDVELSKERETALQIEYDNSTGSASRKFLRPMDIRFYKTMNIWFNFREFSIGDSITLKIGSSEDDYYEYGFSMDYIGIWREIRLKLKSGSNGDVEISNIAGNPDMKRISFIEIGISGVNSGKFWVNDMYVSEPEMLRDSAYWYEGKISFKRPLYISDIGTPVLSDFIIKYIGKGHGYNFNTIGKTMDDIREKSNEVFSSINILPNWRVQLNFSVEDSITDSFNEEVHEESRGETEKKSLLFESDFVSDKYIFPSIKLIYKQDIYDNLKERYISDFRINAHTQNQVYTPTLVLQNRINSKLWGNITTTIVMDAFFQEEDIGRNSVEKGLGELEQFISLNEVEKRQKGGAQIRADYQNSFLFFKPSVNSSTHEIVELKGRMDENDMEILSEVDGGFHLPFVYNKDFKFVGRDKEIGLSFGLRKLTLISPELRLVFNYIEDNFSDYDDSERIISDKYIRSKDANTLVSNRLDLPFAFNKIKGMEFFRNLNISYSRSIFFQEIDVPYEGEGTSSLDEDYGIRRVYNGFADICMNPFDFPPWYPFMGRGNFANGRDYAYRKFNREINYTNGSSAIDYNNNLRLIDNIGVSSTLDFRWIVLNFGMGLNQVSERQNIYGTPQQVVTVSDNLNIIIDLMQIFNFWFFRPNVIGMPYHSASVNAGYDFSRNMIITSNIEEDTHSPNMGIIFKWDRTSLSLNIGMDYRLRKRREYISTDESKRSKSDDIYVTNMQIIDSFKERERGYNFSILYETDVQLIYNLFSNLYELESLPIISLEYSLLLNRYDYSDTVSPEPYDQHLIIGKLTMDLHKNIQGGLSARWALERFRNRDTNGINREIRSYEIGFSLTLLF
ncbi:MAG: hypothetical protein SVZ03_14090 [Spirochaetota bacterium]|nr:hypothetical protein [Spirochaetota bacterium]